MDNIYYKKYIKYKSKYFELKGGIDSVNITSDKYVFKTTIINESNQKYIYSTINSCIKELIISSIDDTINITYDDIKIDDTDFITFIISYIKFYEKLLFKITDNINYKTNDRKIYIIAIYIDDAKYNYKAANITTTNIIDETNDENTPPHKINIFKELMRIYLGIMPKVIAANSPIQDIEGNQIDQDGTIKAKDYKIKTTYNKFENEYFIIKSTPEELKYIDSNGFFCFTPGCNIEKHGVHLFILGTRLIITFATGKISNDYNLIIQEQTDNFYTFINNILKIIEDNKIDDILLCGHSNGMSSATIITFLLLYLQESMKLHSNKKNKINNFKNLFKLYFIEHNDNYHIFTNLSTIAKLNITSKLQNLKLYLVGTAGFPVIFDELKQYTFFYELLNKNYLHIGLCDNENKVDTFMKNINYNINRQYYIYNKDTLCYYGKNTEKINFLYTHAPIGAVDNWIRQQPEYSVMKELTDWGEDGRFSIFKNKYPDKIKKYKAKLQKQIDYANELHMFESYRNVLLPFFL